MLAWLGEFLGSLGFLVHLPPNLRTTLIELGSVKAALPRNIRQRLPEVYRRLFERHRPAGTSADADKVMHHPRALSQDLARLLEFCLVDGGGLHNAENAAAAAALATTIDLPPFVVPIALGPPRTIQLRSQDLLQHARNGSPDVLVLSAEVPTGRVELARMPVSYTHLTLPTKRIV